MNSAKLAALAAGTAIALLPAAHAGGPLAIGSSLGGVKAAEVKMKNVDGRELSVSDSKGEHGTLVIFTCNHCPYVKAWEERTVALGNRYLAKGIGVIAVNPNDPEAAGDTPDAMEERVKERGIGYPYVIDATSGVARAFGATRTPEFFLFDRAGKLVYHGALDDNAQKAEEVKVKWLENALDATIAGSAVTVAETKAIGCSIKFRK